MGREACLWNKGWNKRGGSIFSRKGGSEKGNKIEPSPRPLPLFPYIFKLDLSEMFNKIDARSANFVQAKEKPKLYYAIMILNFFESQMFADIPFFICFPYLVAIFKLNITFHEIIDCYIRPMQILFT